MRLYCAICNGRTTWKDSRRDPDLLECSVCGLTSDRPTPVEALLRPGIVGALLAVLALVLLALVLTLSGCGGGGGGGNGRTGATDNNQAHLRAQIGHVSGCMQRLGYLAEPKEILLDVVPGQREADGWAYVGQAGVLVYGEAFQLGAGRYRVRVGVDPRTGEIDAAAARTLQHEVTHPYAHVNGLGWGHPPEAAQCGYAFLAFSAGAVLPTRPEPILRYTPEGLVIVGDPVREEGPDG